MIIRKNYNDVNLLKVYDGFSQQDEIFLVMVYKHHQVYQDYYENFSMLQIKKYMYALFEALNSLHKLGIVHRDIKPQNFLYDPDDDSCMLVDFGLAETDVDEIDDENYKKLTSDYPELVEIMKNQKIHNLKHRIGTRGFLAPEVIFNCKTQTKGIK